MIKKFKLYIKKFNLTQYDLVNKFLMNDFTDDICEIIKKKEKYTIFDIGCFKGKFSSQLNEKLKNAEYYLFDPQESLDNDFFKSYPFFKFYPFAVYEEESLKTYYLNTMFPASGSSIDSNTKNDWMWNLTRKIITLNFFSKYEKKIVNTITLDKFTKEKEINFIDVLKIDVEGSELKVLKGSKDILERTEIILIEICDTKVNFTSKYDTIIVFLKKYNFKLIKEKKIHSYSILSGQKAVDVLFAKT